jgi:hypothetical protein
MSAGEGRTEDIGKRDADIILPSVKIGERLSPLAATELSDLCIALEAMAEVVRIPGGRYLGCGWALGVRVRGCVPR